MNPSMIGEVWPEPVEAIRPEVLAFARLMEARLRQKDADKGTSWKTMREADLTAHAVSFAMRLDQAVRLGFFGRRKHAIDLANYCMMIADVAGALECGKVHDGTAAPLALE